MKAALCNLMSCEEVLEDDNPLEAFSKGLLNFYSHYCIDKHDSPRCKFHAATNEDGSPYTTKSPLLCSVQSEALENLLKNMAGKPQLLPGVVCVNIMFIHWGTVHWQYVSKGLVSYYLVLHVYVE